jgi:hypothetical protein
MGIVLTARGNLEVEEKCEISGKFMNKFLYVMVAAILKVSNHSISLSFDEMIIDIINLRMFLKGCSHYPSQRLLVFLW